MKLDKGQSKNRHVIRPRNVDQNKKLLVATDREESTTEMQISRVANIEVPKIDLVTDRKPQLKLFVRPDFYYKHLTLPSNSLENILGYEIIDEDLQMIDSLTMNKKIPPGLVTAKLFEEIIELWENDTGKGQLIPDIRATYLAKEHKICERLEAPENMAAGNYILNAFYEHWAKMRDKMGRPLIRRYWKSEGVSDSQIKLAFQSRGSGYRERMRLRNSKKNDSESYEKMKNLMKQIESLQTIFKGILCREEIKKYCIENKIAAFEVEKCEKLQRTSGSFLPDNKILEVSKELRNSTKVVEFTPQVVPTKQPSQAPFPKEGSKKEVLQPTQHSQVDKNSDISFEVALFCCKLISEGEKLKLWPLIDPKRGEGSENTQVVSRSLQLQNEEKLKMRGRLSRCSKRISIDRLIINDCEHSWGRYMGLSGNWHTLGSELHADYYDDEDNEAFQRLHKLLTLGVRNFSKVRNH